MPPKDKFNCDIIVQYVQDFNYFSICLNGLAHIGTVNI